MNFLDPSKILDEIGIKENMLVAEFGCGSGNFAILLAQRIPEGVIYALDVQKQVLSALEGRAKQQGLTNIKTIHCDLERKNGSGLNSNFLDLVLMPNVLFQAENKKEMLEEGVRILKKNGQILIIDWKKNTSVGPKQGKISKDEVKKIAKELGLELEKEFDSGIFHYVLLFSKKIS
ncbi:MAG: methyltransferase domain-containing protein [Candidatus Pacebacteria bacterium]|nr:methyltransferase domain-containing protein [Candidatus Paceibacterota bacterium]